MPYNPTTEMDLALWELARTIRSDPESFQVFHSASPAELSDRFQARSLPPSAARALSQFLTRYAGRGFGEIDLGRPRWGEDPTHVFEMLSSFLQIQDETQAPDVVFARSAQSAEHAIDILVQSIRQARLGWLKAPLARFFAVRARALMGLRESPKFFAVRLMYLIRQELLKSGQEFVQAGELDQADDFFFLTFKELDIFARQPELTNDPSSPPMDWQNLIKNRRQTYQREFLRKQIPRLLVSDGRAVYEGIANPLEQENAIVGSPVSPGSVEGLVRVVLDPRQAGLLPGEILVCPGTDPSWTPLFLSAAGLVMEVGGMMTHGAVVAREYGIPAVVGVDRATTRLHTGQRIRLDGSSGQIFISQ
jgi:pyruvate,water dikinase